MSRFLRRDHAGRLRAPQKVEAAAQKMIREVIACRDSCKGAPDKAGILLWKCRFDAGVNSGISHRKHKNERATAQEGSRATEQLPPGNARNLTTEGTENTELGDKENALETVVSNATLKLMIHRPTSKETAWIRMHANRRRDDAPGCFSY
jgi:hypothetical protein